MTSLALGNAQGLKIALTDYVIACAPLALYTKGIISDVLDVKAPKARHH